MHLPDGRPFVGDLRPLSPTQTARRDGPLDGPLGPRAGLSDRGAATCAAPIAPWRPGWGARRYAAALAVLPLAWVAYAQAAAPMTGPWWVASIAVLATAAALIVASYLPRSDGVPRPAAAPCAASPLFQVVFAGVLLSLGGGVFGHLVALLAVGAALAQRSFGSSTCSVGPIGG